MSGKGTATRYAPPADFVASLTEPDAQVLYRRLTGEQMGALTDAVVGFLVVARDEVRR
jgi:hypothetical protein